MRRLVAQAELVPLGVPQHHVAVRPAARERLFPGDAGPERDEPLDPRVQVVGPRSELEPVLHVLGLDNLEAVLAEPDVSLSTVMRMNTYTTDVDAMCADYGLEAEHTAWSLSDPTG